MRGDVETETMGLSDDLRVEEPALDAADALSAAAAALVDAQQPVGAFVASFEMAPRDVQLALALTRPQLAQLQAECDPSDDVVHGWRRVRGKKGSRVRLWERGAASALTRTGVDGKLARALLRRRSAAPASSSSPAASRSQRRQTSPASASPATPPPPPTPTEPARETYAVRSSITVHAPLASVMKALDCSTATSYRSFSKIMYEALVADTSVLSHARVRDADADASTPTEPTHLAESLAVRWVVCKCASPLVSDVDLSLVEYSKVHSIDELVAAGDAPHNNNNQDSDNDDGHGPEHEAAAARDGLRVRERLPAAYKVLRSMETRHCPVLSAAPHHLERVHVPLGGFLLYRTDNEDVTDVVFFLSASYERKKPASGFRTSDDRQFRAIQHVLHRLALGVGRIENAVDAYTMSLQLETLRRTRWIENSDRSECVVCFHRFHPLTRRRHHCRLCGDVICRDCSVHKDADLPTVGPTTLRICKLCDVQHFGRSSVLATIATDVKRSGRSGLSAFQQRELALETTTFESPTVLRQRLRHRRQTELSAIEASKSSSKAGSSTLDSPKAAAMARSGRRHSLDCTQPLSCPKPTLAPPRGLAERWASRNDPARSVAAPSPSPSPLALSQQASPGSGKWSKAFFANRTPGATTPTHAMSSPRTSARKQTARATPLHSPPGRFTRATPLPHSVSKDATSASSGGAQRFNFGFMKSATMSPHQRPRQLSTGELSVHDSPANQQKTAPLRAFGSSLSPRHSGLRKTSRTESDNQSRESDLQQQQATRRSSSQRDSGSLPLGRRARLDPIDEFEDLLRELCERASDAADARYAAVSVFTSQNPAKSTSDGSALTMAHYLKVRGAPKLMKVAPNLRCCEPILRVVRPVVTRNALTFRLEGCDFAQLPFVKGPQQARFYAGVPLEDSQQRLVGALAVFDAQLVDEDDEVRDCPELLESIARATMARVESRRADRALETFMNTPLLRQSEPVVVSRRGDDAFDADNDDDVDEEHVRSLHIPPRRHQDAAPSPSTRLYQSQGAPVSSSKTNSLNYYKQQMHRLVQQANQTQDQVMQHAAHVHGVSY